MKAFAAVILSAAALTAASLGPVDEAAFPKLIDAHKGKVVLVNFWATWCVPCRAEMPQLVKLQAKLKPRGFDLVTISADEPEQEADAVKFLEKFAVPFPAYIKRPKDDEKFINMIDPKWSGELPTLVIYDRSGKKAKAFFGETDMAALEAAIVKLF